MLRPIYLTANGSSTTEKPLAALCHISPATRLYCGNFVTPITAPVGAPAALFSSVRGSGEEGWEEEAGVVMAGFGVLEGKVGWRDRRFKEDGKEGEGGEGEVEWVYRLDGSMSVWAVFGGGGVGMSDAVRAELMVDYTL